MGVVGVEFEEVWIALQWVWLARQIWDYVVCHVKPEVQQVLAIDKTDKAKLSGYA